MKFPGVVSSARGGATGEDGEGHRIVHACNQIIQADDSVALALIVARVIEGIVSILITELNFSLL